MDREYLSSSDHWTDGVLIYYIKALVKIKTPVSNVFIDGVAYMCRTNSDINIYVVSVVYFMEKFKPYPLLDESHE